MEWRDQGALISVRPQGESAAIIEVFTAGHGRRLGLVRGGGSRRMAPVLQPGAQLDLRWRDRQDGHIGLLAVEPIRARAAIMAERGALTALGSLCAMLHLALPESEPHPVLFQASTGLLDLMDRGEDWRSAYLRWEMTLLEEIGFGLDLSRCAVNGSREDLAYVSPRSGRAVSRQGAGDWAGRLLPLPAFLLGQGPASAADLVQGLALTGHFLGRELMQALHGRDLPPARSRLVELMARGG